MAKKFFSSNYGSPLMRVDNSGIQQAGQAYGQAAKARGQMFANIGSQIGGAIEKYALNKEKREAEENAAVGGLMGLSPESLKQFASRNPKVAGAVEKIINGTGGAREVALVNAGLAPFIAGQAREDKQKESRLTARLLEQEFNSKEKLKEVEDTQKTQKDKAFTGLIARADEALGLIKSGDLQYDDLNVHTKRLVNDRDLLFNRQVDPNDYAYSTDAEAKAALDKLEAKRLAGDIEEQDLEIAEKTEKAAKMPEFSDRASAVESVKDLPKGVSASFKKFKDGFDVELQYKAEESTDIPSVPGYPNYKKVGGFLYEADPKKKTLRKLDPEDFGEKSELLQNTIKTLTTKDVEQYGLAKFRGVRNDDGDYDVEDPASGETITIPFNQDLENRLIYLDGLRNKLKTQIDLDLTTR